MSFLFTSMTGGVSLITNYAGNASSEKHPLDDLKNDEITEKHEK